VTSADREIETYANHADSKPARYFACGYLQREYQIANPGNSFTDQSFVRSCLNCSLRLIMDLFLRGFSPISDSDDIDELERRRQQRAARRADEQKDGDTPKTELEPERGGSGRPPGRRKTAIGYGGDDNTGEGFLSGRTRSGKVRLIDEDGSEMGIFAATKALMIAKEVGLDLFIVQPDAHPPVARLMDYGRFKFELEKKMREVKRQHHIIDTREIKMRYQIKDHDFEVKLRHAVKFLKDGDKVRLLIRMRGRELQHKDMAMSLMQRFAAGLYGLSRIDSELQMEGKSVVMVLSPLQVR
jgi:translation initiation factor IF-3